MCCFSPMPSSQSHLPCPHYAPNSWHDLFPLDILGYSPGACYFCSCSRLPKSIFILCTDSLLITFLPDFTVWMCHKSIFIIILNSLITNRLFGGHRQSGSRCRQRFLSSCIGWSWETYFMLGDLGEKGICYFRYIAPKLRFYSCPEIQSSIVDCSW